MTEVIACANQKGGVGKTTTVVSIASYLALDGLRVLVVDMDPQGNATSGLGLDRDRLERSVYHLLLDGSEDGARVAMETTVPGLAVIPSDRSLAGAEVELVSIPGRERRLRTALRPGRDEWDYVFLDCPPSLGLLTVNALTAADSVLIPLQCEYYALEGLGQLLSTIDLIRDHLNPALRLNGVLLTMHDGRTSLSADVIGEVRRHLGDRVYRTVIPRSVRLAEAPSYGRPIATYSPRSRGAEAYRVAASEFLERTGRHPSGVLSAPALARDGTQGGSEVVSP